MLLMLFAEEFSVVFGSIISMAVAVADEVDRRLMTVVSVSDPMVNKSPVTIAAPSLIPLYAALV